MGKEQRICITRTLLALVLGCLWLPAAGAFAQALISVGPYVQFAGPHRAIVRWDSTIATDSIIQYGNSADQLSRRVVDSALTTTHEVILDDIHLKEKYFFRVGCNRDGGETFSEVAWFDNNVNFSRADISAVPSPYPDDELTPLIRQAAEHIIEETGMQTGFCLVYGCGQGRLAFEIARLTDMMVIGVDDNPDDIRSGREKLLSANVYGARITLYQASDLGHLTFTKYLANLIVSERLLTSGIMPGTPEEMSRLLRPSGGVVYLGQPAGCPNPISKTALAEWLDQAPWSYSISDTQEGLWFELIRPDLPGAGWWSHEYGGPKNNGNSQDNLEGATSTSQMMLQWVGWPGADSQVDRQVRGQGPVAKGGRLVYPGFNRIMTMDSYNGLILWSLEIPGLNRFNIPRDSGWICVDNDYVFAAVRNTCWQLNAQTGIREVTHKLADKYDWGCVFRYGDKLYGSAVLADSFYTGWWGGRYWYEGDNEKICSRKLFANDLSGNRLWVYKSDDSDKGVIIGSTICFGGGRVYFLESRNPAAKSAATGRIGSALWQDLYLVALDADSGSKLWDINLKSGANGTPVVANGDVTVFMMYAVNHDNADKGLLILSTTNDLYHLYAFDVDNQNGSSRWYVDFNMKQAGHGGNKKRPLIQGQRVYFEKHCYDLNDGSLIFNNGPWANCGTYAGNAQTILYREGRITLWDTSNGAKSQWANIRPSCWQSVIGSGGMVLAPEGGGGCDCYGWFHTSAAFVRKDN